MSFNALADNLARVRDHVARIKASEGVRQDVRIVAVTKGHDSGAVLAAFEAGLLDVGENRVQEALQKREALHLPLNWHLIGHLQTNKARLVPGAFACVHSVDSWRVAEALAEAVTRHGGEKLSVLLQVNVGGEEQKAGCSPAEAGDLAHRIAGAAQLRLDGLMTMAPFTSDERVQRTVFADLRRMRDTIAGSGLLLPELSMGMSGDYPAAVAEGATMLRLGTVLFGERQ